MSYKQATDFAINYLGKDDGITKNLQQVQKKFEEEYLKTQNRKCQSKMNVERKKAVSPPRGASPI